MAPGTSILPTQRYILNSFIRGGFARGLEGCSVATGCAKDVLAELAMARRNVPVHWRVTIRVASDMIYPKFYGPSAVETDNVVESKLLITSNQVPSIALPSSNAPTNSQKSPLIMIQVMKTIRPSKVSVARSNSHLAESHKALGPPSSIESLWIIR
jgi:hypothetical protein